LKPAGDSAHFMAGFERYQGPYRVIEGGRATTTSERIWISTRYLPSAVSLAACQALSGNMTSRISTGVFAACWPPGDVETVLESGTRG
jgi:hypothetical protein